jgi:hypothetical protein
MRWRVRCIEVIIRSIWGVLSTVRDVAFLSRHLLWRLRRVEGLRNLRRGIIDNFISEPIQSVRFLDWHGRKAFPIGSLDDCIPGSDEACSNRSSSVFILLLAVSMPQGQFLSLLSKFQRSKRMNSLGGGRS